MSGVLHPVWGLGYPEVQNSKVAPNNIPTPSVQALSNQPPVWGWDF